MSSTQEVSSAGTSGTKKTPVIRRSWNESEEAALLDGLKELVVQRMKVENGFKPGYLKVLEDSMIKKIPTTDIRANPHIISKLSTWKKHYYSLAAILSRSGVGFNERGNHKIDCEDDQWEQIVKMDPNARGMRKKQWPYYEVWKEVFGTDRATGENAEDLYEAFVELNANTQPPPPEDNLDGGKESSFDDDIGMASNEAGSQSYRDHPPAKKNGRSKKKARFNEEFQGVCEALADMNDDTNGRLDKLANRIGFEYDMSQARRETFAQLGDIPGLTKKERFNVCELVAFKAERLDIWRGMDLAARAEYVDHLLGKDD